ncbi:hypothetical protein ABEB36_009734 [Hypothenemus hampei]|uniref:Ubiquitin carboxyl-terminal hydrolase n=1 Tax=Hypothenemus hampei TaxID=57062 RepID=A0ABD1EK99_HYPHA
MNRKYQRDSNYDPFDDSSSNSEELNNTSECTHVKKALELTKIKKNLLKSGGFLTVCPECKKLPADPDLQEIEFDLTLWLCLKCGNQACGRSKNGHALQHYNKPHSDCHALCVNTSIWSIWCYDCDNEVNITCTKKLLEAVDYLKKNSGSNVVKEQVSSPEISDKIIDVILTLPKVVSDTTSTGTLPKNSLTNFSISLPRARGLTNLGNTCFFNSVMQCLGQTPYLVQLLDETSKSQVFLLPGGVLKLKDKEIILPPLDGESEIWRPLMQTLAQTLHELQSGRPEVYNPRLLLQKLISRMPQFGGGDQHDSHELLRHLLEAVHEEDQRRFKAVILEKLGLNKKTDPSTVDEEKKPIIKFYGQQVSELLLATEQIFKGALVSTLQCQVCGHLSHREEKFLDLSLPISEKQVAPILRRKAEDNEDNKPSKHQMKKEKRAEKKKNKKQRHNNNNIKMEILKNNAANNTDTLMENNSGSEESDADIEDNVEEPSTSNQIIALPAPGEDFPSKGMESGYNSDKIENSSPDSNRNNSPNVDDSGVPSPIINHAPNSPASSEANVDTDSPIIVDNSSPEEDFRYNNSFPRPVSRLAFATPQVKNIDLKEDLEKLSLLNDGDSSKVNGVSSHQGNEGACAMEISTEVDEEEEEKDIDEDPALYEGTLSRRYQCEEGECSVESCLNQFTECELMTGLNKVNCDLCTKRSGNKKSVSTDASKQLLIYNPPPVLILHLKRFQVCRFRSAKVLKFVRFSTLLDLAPFCSKRSQNLPTIEPGQSKVLYSLYGIVEHSGSIHGGHYVSYVKVRAPLDENNPRWRFIPKNQREQINKNFYELGATGTPEVPAGKWYYISDSYVTEVPESKVLSVQAYLLFYERLL